MPVRHAVTWVGCLALLTSLLIALPPTADEASAGGATCSTPRNQTVRSLSIDFDQCVAETRDINGTPIEIHVFYLEDDLQSNTDRCLAGNNDNGNLDEPDDLTGGPGDTPDGVPDRCEHKILDADDGSGDNLLAVRAIDEAELSLDFYDSVGLDALGGETTLEIFIAEDPGNGGVPSGTRLNLDDEGVDRNDLAYNRSITFHELQHLVQRFQGYSGATAFTSEGIARATQDRFDAPTDLIASWGFTSDANRLLRNLVPDGGASPLGYRRDTVDNVSYRGMSWWLWFMDQYTVAGESLPATGWDALVDYYAELVSTSDQLTALRNVIADRGSTFDTDFIDYTLALWAHDHAPTDPRLTFEDVEYLTLTDAFDGHTTASGAPAPTTDSFAVSARSSVYLELDPSATCDYAVYEMSSPTGTRFGMSAMRVAGGVLTDRWTSVDETWARAMPTDGADLTVGVVTGLSDAGDVDVEWGCAQPSIDVTMPTTNALAYAGLASDPRRFIVRAQVTAGGAPLGGLLPDDFSVTLNQAGGGPDIAADIVTGAYTGDRYWLLVQAPDEGDGAQTGVLYDVTVDLDTVSDTNPASVAYLERTLDRVVVLDVSGSMDDVAGKFEAAKNAATLMTLELADDDQGGFVTFADAAATPTQLDEMDAAQRTEIAGDIAAPTAGGGTSIGAGLLEASGELAARGQADNVCTLTVLSDGDENVEPLVGDPSVEDAVVADGCPIDAVAFGPDADEDLMDDLSDLVEGGTYDYAPVSGQVPLPPDPGPSPAAFAGAVSQTSLTWQNHLARVYDRSLTAAAGRERLRSAAGTVFGGCSPSGGTDFGDQVVGTTYPAGQGFTSNGVAVQVTGSSGQVSISEQTPGAASPAMEISATTAQLGFSQTSCLTTFAYSNAGGSVALTVNGQTVDADRVSDLDGQTVGGVQVTVATPAGTTARVDTGTVTLTGDHGGFAMNGRGLRIDDVVTRSTSGGLPIEVDPTSDLLVVATAWQQPDGSQVTTLVRPDGTPVPATSLRRSPVNTGEVWEVQDPPEGTWRLRAPGIGQELVVTASARTDIALDLLPFPGGLLAGDEVPVLASFVDADGPVVGGTVQATIGEPDGDTPTITLHDDGQHGDGLADDGIYGNRHQTGFQGDTLSASGTYLVTAVGQTGGHVREDQGAFAVGVAPDNDRDRLPDNWETAHGLDPTDPDDAGEDQDGDGLTATCEFRHGLHPLNSDTDGGGVSDGGEVNPSSCTPQTDPLDPEDDPVDPPSSAQLDAALAEDGTPILVVTWGRPGRGTLGSVDVFCRTDGGAPRLVGTAPSGQRLEIRDDVRPGQVWDCQIRPTVRDTGGTPRPAGHVDTGSAVPSADPNPPVGSIVVDGGALTTTDRLVDLQIEANDHVSDDGHEGEGAVPGDAPGDLEMRVGVGAAVEDAPWQPFAPLVSDFDLGEVSPGDRPLVNLQLRDTAGNTDGGIEGDDILVVGEGERVEGPTRVETAVEVSQASFPDGGAAAVVLARADDFPDAVAGTPLAVQEGAPILLTTTSSLHPATQAELQRVLPPGRTVYILGGSAAVGIPVQEALRQLGYQVDRLSGPTRFETAVAIARAIDGPELVLLATHDDFAAALAAGPVAGINDGVILLTQGGTSHPATRGWLDDHPDLPLHAVGGPAAAAHPTAEALTGGSREGDAVAVADAFFPQPGVVGLARSTIFADALTGGPHMARLGGPLLLTPDDALAPEAGEYVCRTESLGGAFVYGGTSAVSAAARDDLAARIAGPGCP